MSLADAIRVIAEAGYDGYELSIHSNHIHPYAFDRAEIEAIKKIIRQAEIRPICLATGVDNALSDEAYEPSLISKSMPGRNKRIRFLIDCIEIAKELSIPVVNFASGKRKSDVSSTEAWGYLTEGVSQCLAHAQGVTLALEPEPDFFISTTVDAIALIEQIDSPSFRLNLDIGHVYVCEDDYLEAIQNALPLTAHIHIEDIKKRVHRHEIPGEGEIDFESVFRSFRAQGYSHFISVELYHHSESWRDALQKSYRYLTNMINRTQDIVIYEHTHL